MFLLQIMSWYQNKYCI